MNSNARANEPISSTPASVQLINHCSERSVRTPHSIRIVLSTTPMALNAQEAGEHTWLLTAVHAP